jgi:hypothetical protein
MKEGKGKWTAANGTSYEGEWKQDYKVQAILLLSSNLYSMDMEYIDIQIQNGKGIDMKDIGNMVKIVDIYNSDRQRS